ncbi:hypothetical protein WR25_13909 [Diploscapter pachys]|uniref:TGS domain-containing protein n=1 Tax=Diploscapter pachys TaxID=2018661 RepID=A0A2A2K5D2_9BILA|nr:hypothetical protein WR25_13909 [Diploscapter pachys]
MKLFLRLRPFQKAPFSAGFSRGLASSADSVTNFDALERKKFVPSIESFAELKQKIYGSDKSIEKMVVRTQQLNSEKDVTMIMNRNQSTSYNCSLHLNSHLHERSAFAFIRDINDRDELIEDSKALVYGMNTPLTKKCHVQFVEIANLEHVELVNEIIWRSMTFFLSAIVKLGFRNPPEILERKAVVEDGYFYVDVEGISGPELSPEELYRLNLFIKRDMIACNAFFQQLVIPDNIAEEYGIPTG